MDEHDFLEVHSHWAPNIIVAFARMNGRTVGVVANQPMQLAELLTLIHRTRRLDLSDFAILSTFLSLHFVDVPGYMPGLEQEVGRNHQARLEIALRLLRGHGPKITIVVRKAYGGAYCAMGSKYPRSDLNFAWPSAQLAVMGPEGAVAITSGGI